MKSKFLCNAYTYVYKLLIISMVLVSIFGCKPKNESNDDIIKNIYTSKTDNNTDGGDMGSVENSNTSQQNLEKDKIFDKNTDFKKKNNQKLNLEQYEMSLMGIEDLNKALVDIGYSDDDICALKMFYLDQCREYKIIILTYKKKIDICMNLFVNVKHAKYEDQDKLVIFPYYIVVFFREENKYYIYENVSNNTCDNREFTICLPNGIKK